MSYSATFKRGGKTSTIMNFSYSFSKMVDDKGRPSSRVSSAIFTITIDSGGPHKGDMIKWLSMDSAAMKGEDIEIQIADDDMKIEGFKKIKLQNTHIISYDEQFYDGSNMSETFSISAEKVTVENAEFDFKWPKT